MDRQTYGRIEETELSDELQFLRKRDKRGSRATWSETRNSGKSRISSLENNIKHDEANTLEVVYTVWATVTPFFSRENPAYRRTWVMVVAIVVILMLDNAVMVFFSYVQRDYMTALEQKHEAMFYTGMLKTLGCILVLLPIVATYQYTLGWFVLSWRTFLTNQLLKRYFSRHAYYHLKSDTTLDNPDQRIGQDVDKFTEDITWLLTSLLDSILSLVSFFGVLYSISPTFSICLVIYASVGTLASVWGFGRQLMFMSKRVLGQEADFRFALVRTREHAESIAFYDGADAEESRAKASFGALLATRFRLLLVSVKLKLFTRSFTWITFMLPPLLSAGAYFRGEIKFGTISQTQMAFSHILQALSLILNNLNSISQLSAEALRIHLLFLALDHAEPKSEKSIELTTSTDICVRAKDLCVQNPAGIVLYRDVTFECNRRLLIVGRTGCGKSSLLRVLAGLWNYGSGSVQRPDDCMFVSQSPYIPHDSTLLQIVSYPQPIVDEERARNALHAVNLSHIGALHTKREWSILSLGEQQRLSFARVLLSQPTMVFFDEATSALDLATEKDLYDMISHVITTFVSVGHRPSLLQFHSHVLSLENGVGVLCTTTEYSAR